MTKWSKYTKNDFYWSKPTIENSYFAGFIAADGCIVLQNGKYPRLQVVVEKSDQCVLDTLKDCLQYTGPINQNKAVERVGLKNKLIHIKPQASLILSSTQYYDDLNRWYNITPRKSLTLQPPNIIDPEMIKAFIVGYIDGDGCIYVRNNPDHRNKLRICILGTSNLLTWISNNLSITNKPYVKSGSNIYVLDIGGEKANKVYNYLMSVNVPRLERKWKYACSI